MLSDLKIYNMRNLIRNNKGLIAFVLFVSTFKAFAYNGSIVPTGSMIPTIDDKSYIIVDTHAYGLKIPFSKITLIPNHNPQRNDIAVFRMPKDESVNYVKRIVAIPGDTIYYNKTSFKVNEVPVNPSDYVKVVLPADKYFAIGDNINNSYDSRYWGFIPKENFVGKYVATAFSYKFTGL